MEQAYGFLEINRYNQQMFYSDNRKDV